MTLETNILAQLSAAAYRGLDLVNQIFAPLGWQELPVEPVSGTSTGFSATAYIKFAEFGFNDTAWDADTHDSIMPIPCLATTNRTEVAYA